VGVGATIVEILDPTFAREALKNISDATGTPDSSPPTKGVVLLGFDGSALRRVRTTSDGKLLAVLG